MKKVIKNSIEKININKNLKNIFWMYSVLLISAIISVFLKIPKNNDILPRVIVQSFYIFFVIVISIHIEITIIYIMLKIIGIKNLQYKKINQLLLGTAYYAHSLLTLLIVLTSPILSNHAVEIITGLIEIIKIIISYCIIRNIFKFDEMKKIIILIMFILFAFLYIIM